MPTRCPRWSASKADALRAVRHCDRKGVNDGHANSGLTTGCCGSPLNGTLDALIGGQHARIIAFRLWKRKTFVPAHPRFRERPSSQYSKATRLVVFGLIRSPIQGPAVITPDDCYLTSTPDASEFPAEAVKWLKDEVLNRQDYTDCFFPNPGSGTANQPAGLRSWALRAQNVRL